MATYNYKPGLGLAAAYQVAGKPFVRGNIDASAAPTIEFPSVTSWIVVQANNGDCKVGFSAFGVAGSNYLTVPSGSLSPRLELKVTELYLGGPATSVDVMAGLTYISNDNIDNISVSPSGSNWSGSLGAEVG